MHPMNSKIIYNNQTINFTIVRKPTLKHTYITIQRNGKVVIKANRFVSEKCIDEFVLKKASWILKKQSFFKQNYLHNNYQITKEEAKKVITPLVEKWSKIMNLYPTNITFRNNKTRWGSCSTKNRLSFNIWLLKFPLETIEYVVVHELAHIKYKNHSKEFWSFVESFLPDYKLRQLKLKGI